MFRYPFVVVVILTVSLLQLAPLANADCCDAVVGYGLLGTGLCRDCFLATPCCGMGACNVLCCGCDGSCRQGDFPVCGGMAGAMGGYPYAYPGAGYGGWYKRSDNDAHDLEGIEGTTTRTARVVFSKLDSNSDGKVDEGEMNHYVAAMYRLPNQTLDDVDVQKLYSFQDMDQNHDNYLSLEEIDP